MRVINKLNIAFHILTVLSFLLLAFVPWADFITNKVQLSMSLNSPSLLHPLGTDSLGRDILVRLHLAVKESVLPVWGVVVATYLVATFLSCMLFVSHHSSTSRTILYISSIFGAAIPISIFILVFSILREKIDLASLLFGIVILVFSRQFVFMNDLYNKSKHYGYWLAHHAIGGSLLKRILNYGVLGEWRQPILQHFAFFMSASVVVEASLSYIGFGIQEPMASFGNILSSHMSLYLKGEVSLVLLLVAIMALVLSFPVSAFHLLKNISK